MSKKLEHLFKKVIEYSFYLFVFLFPWQTKIILRSSAGPFTEVSVYLTHFLLLLILIAFFIYQLRRPDSSDKISPLWLALAGLEIAVLLSFFVAPDQILAFYHYILLLVGVGLFYMLRAGTINYGYEGSGLETVKVVYSFLAGMMLHASLGLYQFLTQSAPINKYLGLANHDAGILGASVVEAVSGRWLRAYGGLDHPNILGGVLALALILTAYLLAQKKVIRSRSEIFVSLFLFVFYFIALAALFFSFSRSAWLAYGLGLAVLAFSLIRQKDVWLLGRFLVLVCFSALAVFIIAFPYRDLVFARTFNAWQGESRLENKSIGERRQYLSEAGGIISQHWPLGVGAGNYVSFIERRDEHAQAAWAYQPVHNSVLLLFAQSGVFAVLFFVAFLWFLIIKDRRTVFAAAVIVALLVLMMFDHWLISLPFGILFTFLILGLL